MHASMPDENIGNIIFSCKFPSISPLRPSGTPDFAGKVSHWIFARLRLPTARLSATHDNLSVANAPSNHVRCCNSSSLTFPPWRTSCLGGGLCRVISTSCGYSHWDSNGGEAAEPQFSSLNSQFCLFPAKPRELNSQLSNLNSALLILPFQYPLICFSSLRSKIGP